MTTKKNILFVLPSLDVGGGEKSMANLLSVIDYDRFAVDLLLFHKRGIFLKLLPPEVNVVEIGGDFKFFSKGLAASVLDFAGQFKLRQAFHRLLFAAKNKIAANSAKAEQRTWQNRAVSIAPVAKKYDVAIAFLEKSSVYFTVDKVDAPVKIGWIHTNYANSGMDAGFDKPYFYQLDFLVTVSDECAASLRQAFPEQSQKIKVIQNIISDSLIRQLADAGTAPELRDGDINLVSVGRLSHEKGFDLAIDACAELVKSGIAIHWYIIGGGPEQASLEKKIAGLKLENHFHLLGPKENPYPYVKKALLYVQPSRYEGKSIAIDEAKILHKPIVATHFSTVKDQINHEINGLVAPMDAQGFAAAIARLAADTSLREAFSKALKQENLSTEAEILKLYQLIER